MTENNLKILAFAGSLRKDSINKKLIKYAVGELKKLNIQVKFIDLLDYPIELFNPDITPENFSKNAIAIEKMMYEHDAILIGSPEYNYSISSTLKNLIDYVSKAPKNDFNTRAFEGKVICIMSASPSNLGAVRSTKEARSILTLLGAVVIPKQVNIAKAYEAFNEQGNLISEYNQKAVQAALIQLIEIGTKLK